MAVHMTEGPWFGKAPEGLEAPEGFIFSESPNEWLIAINLSDRKRYYVCIAEGRVAKLVRQRFYTLDDVVRIRRETLQKVKEAAPYFDDREVIEFTGKKN